MSRAARGTRTHHVLGVLLAISVVLVAQNIELLLLTAGTLALFVALTVASIDPFRREKKDGVERCAPKHTNGARLTVNPSLALS